MIAFKNGKSIRNTLISSKFPAPWHTKHTQSKDNLDIENLQNLIVLLQEITGPFEALLVALISHSRQ